MRHALHQRTRAVVDPDDRYLDAHAVAATAAMGRVEVVFSSPSNQRTVRVSPSARSIAGLQSSNWPALPMSGRRRRDRKRVVAGKSVSVRVALGGRRFITKKKNVEDKRR